MIFAVQITVCSGLSRKINISADRDETTKTLVIVFNLLFFVVSLVAGEILHRRTLG